MDIGLEEDIVSVINEITGAWEDLKTRSMEMIDEILRITAKLELIPLPSKKFDLTVVPEPFGATNMTSTFSGGTIPVWSL